MESLEPNYCKVTYRFPEHSFLNHENQRSKVQSEYQKNYKFSRKVW